MRTIKDVIKAIPQLQNQDYEKGSMGVYGEGEYYEFDDGSIVMEDNDLEVHACAVKQHWFWETESDTYKKRVCDTLDIGASWRGDNQSFAGELYNENLDIWDVSGTIHEGSLEDGVYEAFGETSLSISSSLDFVEDIEFGFEDLFEDCYSKTEKVFVLIKPFYAADEENAIFEIAENLGMTTFPEIALIIEEKANSLINAPKKGENISQENMQKLLTLVQSKKEASVSQGIDLAAALDAPNAIDTVIKVLSVDKVIEYMTRARTVVSEIDPDCWNGTIMNNYRYYPDQIINRIAEYIDDDKPYTMVSAYMEGRVSVGYDSPKSGDLVFINPHKVNWQICKDIKVDLAQFKETSIVSDTQFKKIYKMKDWFIALT